MFNVFFLIEGKWVQEPGQFNGPRKHIMARLRAEKHSYQFKVRQAK